MKRRVVILALAALVLLGAAWWWTGPRYALDGPPVLTVSAGGEGTSVGCWSVHWTSPTATFNADGDAPTASYVRSRQPVVYVRTGVETLTLSYPVAPGHVRVSYTPDSGGEPVSLYEGGGKRELSIPLPEDFRGIYEVSETWNTVPPATGNAARGFLVVGEGEPVGDPKLAEPPALTVALPGGKEVIARLGSYSWFVWLGGEEMEGTIADAAHPLARSDLPVLPAQPGEGLELRFAVPPDQLSVWVWSPSQETQEEPVEVDSLSGYDLLVPENGAGKIYEVRASWHLVEETWGQVSYLFQIP